MVRPGFILTKENYEKFKGRLVRIIEGVIQCDPHASDTHMRWDMADTEDHGLDDYLTNFTSLGLEVSKIGMILNLEHVETRLESLYELARRERDWSKGEVDMYLERYCEGDLDALYLEIMDIGSDCWPGTGKSDRIIQKENDEYRKVYKFLRGKLNEVNLLNAKLLYTNKLFKEFALGEDQKMKVMSLSGVRKYPMRVKCATLAWHTLTSAIERKKEEVNTETID